MFETRIQLEEGQRLALIDLTQDAALAGWAEADVLIRLHDGDESDIVIEQTEDGPAVSILAPCEIQVPYELPVSIRQALGNLKIKDLAAEVNAEQVRGNLALSQVRHLSVAEVYGNLKAGNCSSLRVPGTVYGNADLRAVQESDLQNVRGNLRAKDGERLRASRIGGSLQAAEMGGTLELDQVGGNAHLKGIGGAVTLDKVAGNLMAKNLVGGAKVPRIGGNLVLNGQLGAGCTYHFKVGGNATLRLPEEANAHVTLVARGQTLSSVPLADQEREEGRLSGTLGDGGAEIAVEAKGNVLLGGGPRGVGVDLGAEISRQVEEGLSAIDLEAIGRQVGEEMESAMSRLRVKLEGVDWAQIGIQTQQAVERAMERMQRDMDRMAEKAKHHQERVERRMEREQRRAERMQRRAGRAADAGTQEYDWGGEEDAGPVDYGPDLDEERLSILKMVEQGQISPEEAEMLLDALL